MFHIASITFIDDLDMFPEPNQQFRYTKGEQFIEIHTNGKIVELININAVRSMEILT